MTLNNHLDDAGTTGASIDIRPIGFRKSIGHRLVIAIDPLHFAMVVPSFEGIPLVDLQYRTTISLELVP